MGQHTAVVRKMPKYAEKLKPEEIKAIAAHVKSLGKK